MRTLTSGRIVGGRRAYPIVLRVIKVDAGAHATLRFRDGQGTSRRLLGSVSPGDRPPAYASVRLVSVSPRFRASCLAFVPGRRQTKPWCACFKCEERHTYVHSGNASCWNHVGFNRLAMTRLKNVPRTLYDGSLVMPTRSTWGSLQLLVCRLNIFWCLLVKILKNPPSSSAPILLSRIVAWPPYCAIPPHDDSDTEEHAYDGLFDRIEVERSECHGFRHPPRRQFERLCHADYVRFRRTRPGRPDRRPPVTSTRVD